MFIDQDTNFSKELIAFELIYILVKADKNIVIYPMQLASFIMVINN